MILRTSVALALMAVFVGGARGGDARKETREAADKLWSMGLGYFAEGDLEYAKATWFSCLSLDPFHEDCRQGLRGLDRLTGKALPSPAKSSPSGKAERQASVDGGLPAMAPAVVPPATKEVSNPSSVDGSPSAAAPSGKGRTPPSGDGSPSAAAPQDPKAVEAELRGKAAAEERRLGAITHWNAGLSHYQKGELEKATQEWTQCRALDPSNNDCILALAAQRSTPAPVPAPSSADSKRAPAVQAGTPPPALGGSGEAIRHWNAGVRLFQKGDFGGAREEWLKCRQADASNLDCLSGLKRIERAYGGK